MADKAISELVAAPSVTPDSLFVLQQDGTAKKLTAQVLENWLVSFADGHGGIQSYELLKTVGLVKTYRFTLADQTPIDIDVVDGRGIESVKPTSTNGLVVTYTITYNDGKTDTITVTNGAKGDEGDRADIWVKYASQKPTASSHSFGDVPDSWIGIATGHNMDAAPTDWQQYTWFQWKGEKGDTGEPAILMSATVTYQAGTSGTVIPSGSWSSSIPSVAQGQYLWTKIVQQFNTGDPITAYSVSRMGLDGLGAVVSVNNVSPDGNGNVALDAASVKALPITGGTMEGSINMNGQKLSGLNQPSTDNEAATKGYVDTAIRQIDVSSQVAGKVDKSSVVNNFNTTEEGFVADARTVKILNDSKLSMELLWENASPSSAFVGNQTITADFGGYGFIVVDIAAATSLGYQYSNIIHTKGNAIIMQSTLADGRFVNRVANLTEEALIFGEGKLNGNVDNDCCIPIRIYGLKGEIA